MPPAMKNAKVLILEKNILFASRLMHILEKSGCLVTSKVASFKKALPAINEEKPDFVMMHIANTKSENWAHFNNALINFEGLHLVFLVPSLDPQFVSKEEDKPPKSYMVIPDIGYFDRASVQQAPNPVEHQFDFDDIWIKRGTRHERVKVSDILWIEAKESYCEIMVEGDQPYLLSSKLKTVHELLDHPKIMRVHRSFSVNLDKIAAFDGNILYIGKKAITIGRTFREAFIKNFPAIMEQGCLIKSQQGHEKLPLEIPIQAIGNNYAIA
jgi:hypothetical protein